MVRTQTPKCARPHTSIPYRTCAYCSRCLQSTWPSMSVRCAQNLCRCRPWLESSECWCMPVFTGVNPAGDAGDTSPSILVGGTSTGIFPQYYHVLSDIADQYWLPSVRSASSRFHSAIRRHQFASVRQADSRLTRLNLELASTSPLCVCACVQVESTA